jgi:hypothetical protein
MKPIFCLASLLAAITLAPAKPPASPNSGELIVCGWDEVFILDMNSQPPAKVWSWKAAGHPELPEEMRTKFNTTDDCKPVDGGKRILITSSGRGIALVERASGQVLFYGAVGSAHSADMLPRGRVVVAASTHEQGNRFVVFDLKKSGQPLFSTEGYGAHGVVWDGSRHALWALSGVNLRAYRLADWETGKPRLEKTAEYLLPEPGGHDLAAVPGTNWLSVTTGKHAWVFDRDRHVFSPHPQLGNRASVKCITVNPVTKQTVWTQADEGFWWTGTLRFLNPEKKLELTGQHLYKARWVNMQ